MKKKTILYLVSLFFLSVPLTGRGQDKKAWEIGAGGSLINWSRVSVTGFQSTPDNYMYNLKANHLMGGANLYCGTGTEPVVLSGFARYGRRGEKQEPDCGQ